MKNRPTVILTAVLLIIIFMPIAMADFEVSYTTVSNQILHSDTAYFNIIITNNLDVQDTYRMYWTDIDWSFRSIPSSYYFTGFTLEPGETKEIEVQMRPSDRLPYYTYFLPLDIESQNTQRTENLILPVILRSPTQEIGEYLTAVGRIVSVNPTQDPRDPLLITVNLKNRNPRNISEFKIIAFSDYFSIEESLPLPPLAERVVQLRADLPSDMSPERISINVRFEADGRELYPQIVENVQVIGYDSIITERTTRRGFFRVSDHYYYTSTGNQETRIEDTHRITFWSRPFATVMVNGVRAEKRVISTQTGQYLSWDYNIMPEEEVKVEIIHNYLSLFWLLVLVLLSGLFYMMMRSPIQTKKDAVVVGVTEGGISEIRVVIHIKNLSSKRFKTINVVDTIPKLAQFVPEKDDVFASTRLYHNQKEGSAIKWTVDSLEKYEERIFTYRLRSKLSILGGLSLPRTLVRFTDDQQEQVTRSNHVRINL
ncbi:MAG: hypothetical protein ACMXYL_04555 [Candidatus Woesearchaeota archaeon]